MDKTLILQKTEQYVKETLSGESSGHDWWHIHRVRTIALTLGREENTDLFIVEMAALLHDIGDPKLHGGDTTIAPRLIGSWLDSVSVQEEDKEKIMHIIAHMSFSKHLQGKEVDKSKEFMIVQDADRLDAIGAVGIARCFSYGGHKGRIMYDPHVKAEDNITAEQYTNGRKGNHTINHFYEKLLLLKKLMNTETAKRMAEERHLFMERYLEQFYEEWDGKK